MKLSLLNSHQCKAHKRYLGIHLLFLEHNPTLLVWVSNRDGTNDSTINYIEMPSQIPDLRLTQWIGWIRKEDKVFL